jgi:hypothetical protein
MSSSTFAAAAFVVFSLTAAPALAQQRPAPEAGQPEKKEQPVTPLTGELLSVDDKARTFSIKTATEGEVKFSYSDETVIVGAEKGAQGLAATGTEVTVHYDSHGTAKVATRIEVKPKK